MLWLFFKALVIGLAVAAPVGPIGVICMHRTLNYGPSKGVMSGLGAASADAVYGIVGLLGFSLVMVFLEQWHLPITLAGIVFMLWLGMTMFKSSSPDQKLTAQPISHWHAYLTTFLLTLANPMTIGSFMAIFLAIGGQTSFAVFTLIVMVIGVFCGSLIWWWFLVQLVNHIKHRLGPNTFVWINRLAGSLILLVAVWQGGNLIVLIS